MQRCLKILVFMVILIVLAYLYRAELKETTMQYLTLSEDNVFNALKSKLNLALNTTIKMHIEGQGKDNTSNIASKYLNPFDVLRGENGVIFVETTDRMQPPSLVLCAVESAARVYKDRPVVYFMKGLNDTDSEDAVRKYLPALSSLKNVYVFPLRMEEVFKDTPLLSWYKKVDPKREVYWTHVSSDGCRLALIWKHGGIYFDTDIISIQKIPHQYFLAEESSQYFANSAFGFPSHQEFTWKCMEDFVRHYRGAVWGYQGPNLITRIFNQYCPAPSGNEAVDTVCGNITCLLIKRLYPISYSAWKRYFEVWDKEPTFGDSYALHLWNFMNRDEHRTMVPGSNTLVEHLYQKYCPSTYGLTGKNNMV
ncbi:alpha-1,4-N-acetylglucosaminyltransferase-like [Hyperolius riggenbachi]|uniref:alpha-1,4-N-acetylglucosaminyltransferase-like n=1 Tax=Hyperolius riggenbachi TaxID=752182 RepID=UPI0035A2A7A8